MHVKPQAFKQVSKGSAREQGSGAQIPALDGHPFLEA